MSPEPLLVIAGPTASGKSGLALAVAERLDGEIVSADAFAAYRGLDIGTDKPSAADRRRVRHHLIDVVDPRERFSAGDFQRAADVAVADIRARGVTPVVAGGTHFYVEALLFGLFAAPPHDAVLRARLEEAWERDPAEVRARLAAVDPAAADRIPPGDRQRVLRALEVFELTGAPLTQHWSTQRKARRYNALLVVPERPRQALYDRINRRVDMMFAAGLVGEVRQLLAAGVPPRAHALKAIGYREIVSYLAGEMMLEDAVEHTKRASRNLAKRQLTWLRNRCAGIVRWVPPLEARGNDAVIRLWESHRHESGDT